MQALTKTMSCCRWGPDGDVIDRIVTASAPMHQGFVSDISSLSSSRSVFVCRTSGIFLAGCMVLNNVSAAAVGLMPPYFNLACRLDHDMPNDSRRNRKTLAAAEGIEPCS